MWRDGRRLFVLITTADRVAPSLSNVSRWIRASWVQAFFQGWVIWENIDWFNTLGEGSVWCVRINQCVPIQNCCMKIKVLILNHQADFIASFCDLWPIGITVVGHDTEWCYWGHVLLNNINSNSSSLFSLSLSLSLSETVVMLLSKSAAIEL